MLTYTGRFVKMHEHPYFYIIPNRPCIRFGKFKYLNIFFIDILSFKFKFVEVLYADIFTNIRYRYNSTLHQYDYQTIDRGRLQIRYFYVRIFFFITRAYSLYYIRDKINNIHLVLYVCKQRIKYYFYEIRYWKKK